MGKIDTKELLQEGVSLKEQRAEIVRKQAANRTLLRNLADSDLLSETEEDQLAEIYPERQRAEEGEGDVEGEFEDQE